MLAVCWCSLYHITMHNKILCSNILMLKMMRHKVYFDTILIHGQGDPLLPIIITDTSIIDIVSRTDPEEARCLCQCFCLCNSIHLICMLGWLQGVLYWAWSTVWQPVSVNGEKAFLFSLYLSVCACACACVCVCERTVCLNDLQLPKNASKDLLTLTSLTLSLTCLI